MQTNNCRRISEVRRDPIVGKDDGRHREVMLQRDPYLVQQNILATFFCTLGGNIYTRHLNQQELDLTFYGGMRQGNEKPSVVTVTVTGK